MNPFNCSEETSEENCVICGYQAKSKRFGYPACMSCTVFFRRSVIKNADYSCLRHRDCQVFKELRAACKYCRFQKCIRFGMKQSFVVTRDLTGPRNSSLFSLNVAQSLVKTMVVMQQDNWKEHRDNQVEKMRRATVSDVNQMFKWSFNNAIEWAAQFEPFVRLSNKEQKCVISEYGFMFFIIDQGFRNAEKSREGIWMLQNGTFFDYFDYSEHQNIDNSKEKR
uniref:Nuclear receptor domain-containing protein n=1 Tax=Caenorhabditis tropicalis TaxID=1561998 RepID=A0A1I7SYD0_9PELO